MSDCPSCHATVPAGTRWCGICHSNVIDVGMGRLASPFKRLASYVLDLFIPVMAFFVMLSALGASAAAAGEAGVGVGALLAFCLFIAYVVGALKLFANGTTPGKKALGLRVMREDGRTAGFGTMLVREWVGKWLSSFFLALGFFWILFDRDRQGWHDKLVSTFVVEGFAPEAARVVRPVAAG